MTASSPIFHYDQVYYVESLEGNPVNPVAIRPEIFDSHVQWLDTSKGKVVELSKIDNMDQLGKAPPDVIKITAKNGEHFTLVKLTLDVYNEKVKNRVMLPPSFASDEAVQNFYLTADFEPY